MLNIAFVAAHSAGRCAYEPCEKHYTSSSTIIGRVVDDVTDRPITGAFVSLHSETGIRVAGALTDSAGIFRLPHPTVARTIQVELIGYRRFTRHLVTAVNASAIGDLRLIPEPISLPTITAKAKRFCGKPGADSEHAAILWETIRAELDRTAWSEMESQVGFIVSSYRTIRQPPTFYPETVTVALDTLFRFQPFTSDSIEHIAERGFLVTNPDGTYVYWAPSTEVLVSDWFVRNHCFRPVRKGQRTGLEFKPLRSTRHTDVEGTLWLIGDDAPRLQSIEFYFVGGETGKTAGTAKGRSHFSRLPDGYSITAAWEMTVVQQPQTLGKFRVGQRVTVSGGNVVDIVRRDVESQTIEPRASVTTTAVPAPVFALRFADSLRALPATQLPGLYRDWSTTTADAGAMKAAFSALLFAATNATFYDSARVHFSRLATESHAPAWNSYGAALIAAHQEAQPSGIAALEVFKSAIGKSKQAKAFSHLHAALEIDSTFIPAYVTYADLALRTYDLKQIGEAISVIGGNRAIRHPLVLASAIRLELARDSLANVAQLLSTATGTARADPSVRYAEAVYAFLIGNEESGVRPYEKAVSAGDPSVMRRAFSDLDALMVDPPYPQTGTEVLEFWKDRAASVGEPVPVRLRTHFSRLYEARRNYIARAPQRTSAVSAVPPNATSPSQQLDTRGVLLVRRGSPTEIVRTVSDTIDNETWVYRAPGRPPEVFHFVREPLTPNFILSTGIVECSRQAYLMDRAALDTHIQKAVIACHSASRANKEARGDTLAAKFRIRQLHASRRPEVAAKFREERPTDFRRELPFFYSLQSLRDPISGYPSNLVVVAIPAAKLQAETLPSGFRYRYRITVSLVDSLARRTLQKDTVVTFETTTQLDSNTLTRSFVDMQDVLNPTAQYKVRVADLNQPGTGHTYVGRRRNNSGDYATLGMSDIIFVRLSGNSSGWKRESLTLDVSPVQRFSRGKVGVYFEIYNPRAHAAYQIGVMIGEKSGGIFRRRQNLGLSFEEEMGAATTVPVFKEMNLPLRPGKYTMRVTISDVSRTLATREREFVLE